MPSSSSSALSSQAAARASAKPVPGCGSRSRRSSSACVGIVGAVRPDVEAEAGQVDRPRHVREVGGHERARRRAVDGLDRRRLEPVRRVVGHALLEERLAARALREALHQHRAAAHGPHQRLGDGGVVADEVELRLAPLGEEHLAGTADPHLAPGELDHLRVVGHAGTVARTEPSISIVAGSGARSSRSLPGQLLPTATLSSRTSRRRTSPTGKLATPCGR